MAQIPAAQMPKARPVHIKLGPEYDHEEVISTMRVSHLEEGPDLHIPQRLLFAAWWIYDIEKRKVLKNKTGRNFLVPLGVSEVTRDWLGERGFVRFHRQPLTNTIPTEEDFMKVFNNTSKSFGL